MMGETGRLGRRFSLASLVAVAMLAVPSGTSAATIGETFTPDAVLCADNTTFLQTVSPGAPYAAPFDGVFTRWSLGTRDAPTQAKFKVARPAPGADFSMNADFTVVGESVAESPSDNSVNTYPTRIPARAGDVIGFWFSDQANCLRSDRTYANHFNNSDVPPGTTATFTHEFDQLPVSAILERDCDRDGFGDETQDGDLSSCPAVTPPTWTCKGKPATIVGTPGNDVLLGTNGPDVIAGLGGDDKLKGFGGKDLLCGGDGNDIVKGANGADRIFGEGDPDRLFGGAGKDALRGGSGEDEIYGRGNRDDLKGNRGDDKMGGGGGNDILRGNKGNDKLFGQGGKDLCKGGAKADKVKGCEVEKAI